MHGQFAAETQEAIVVFLCSLRSAEIATYKERGLQAISVGAPCKPARQE